MQQSELFVFIFNTNFFHGTRAKEKLFTLLLMPLLLLAIKMQ
jgi:hypothetical protein